MNSLLSKLNFKRKKRVAVLVLSLLFMNFVFDGGGSFLLRDVFASPGHSGGHGEEINGGGSEYPVVTVTRAKSPSEIDVAIEAAGEVLPTQESDVFPVRSGVVKSLNVNVGDYVNEGDVIGYLYPDVQQTVLNADLQLARAQREAAEKRKEFVEKLQGPQREQLEIALTFAENNLVFAEQATDGILSQFATQQGVAGTALDALQKQYEAELERLDVEIANATQKLAQQQVSSVNGISDLVLSIEELMYTSPGVVTGGRVFDTRFRRSAVVNINRSEFQALEQELLQFYKEFSDFQQLSIDDQIEDVDVTQEWLDRAFEISNDARQLATEALEGPTSGEVHDLKKEVDSAIDHLVDVSDGFIGASSDIKSAEVEKITLTADLEQQLAQLQGEIDILEQDKFLSTSERESLIAEKNAEVDSLRAQLGALETSFEQQKLESNLDVKVSGAQESSIRQKIGAGRSIIAPFSGTIARRYVNEGASVSLDRPVYHLVNDDEKFVRFFVNESDLVFVDKEQTVQLVSTATDSLSADALIKRIAPSLDQDTRTVLVEADLVKGDLYDKILANMSVRVKIPVSVDEGVTVIPESALELSGDRSSVWIVNDDIEAELHSVDVKFVHGGYAYLESDLSDLWVIIKSPQPLEEGLEVDTTL